MICGLLFCRSCSLFPGLVEFTGGGDMRDILPIIIFMIGIVMANAALIYFVISYEEKTCRQEMYHLLQIVDWATM